MKFFVDDYKVPLKLAQEKENNEIINLIQNNKSFDKNHQLVTKIINDKKGKH